MLVIIINETIILGNLNNTYYNPLQIRMEDVIKNICNQWIGITYDSNMVYLQIFFYLLVILVVLDFINPKMFISIHKKWKTKIFNKEFTFNIVDREEFVSEFIIRVGVVFLFSKIVYVSYVQYFLIEKISILEFIKRLIGI